MAAATANRERNGLSGFERNSDFFRGIMQFIQFGMLGALGALAIPIIIHLMFRQRAARSTWGRSSSSRSCCATTRGGGGSSDGSSWHCGWPPWP